MFWLFRPKSATHIYVMNLAAIGLNNGSKPVEIYLISLSLQWRHNECDGVSDHQRLDCLFNRLFRRRSKNSPHKGPVTRKIFPFDDVIMVSVVGKKSCEPLNCPLTRPHVTKQNADIFVACPLIRHTLFTWSETMHRQWILCSFKLVSYSWRFLQNKQVRIYTPWYM